MIRKLHRAPDPELDAQLDLILKHEHDDRYPLLRHVHDDRYPLLATTLGGYGITDAYTKVEADGKFGLLANAVIETGSNANGTWRKWVDGTLECWGKKSFNDLTFSATGNIYYNGTPDLVFAAEFYTAPLVDTWIEASTSLVWIGRGSGTSITTTGINNIYIGRGSSSTVNLTIGYHAWGRWQ